MVKCPLSGTGTGTPDVQKVRLPVPPKALGNKGADGMLAALEFEEALSFMASRICGRSTLVLSLCMDSASNNLLAVRKVLAKYKASRTFAARRQSPTVLVVAIRCLAHQVHLCSRSCFAALGNLTGGLERNFLSALSAACHVFTTSAYNIRVVRAAAEAICSAQVLSSDQAVAQGVSPATSDGRLQLRAFLLYMLRWARASQSLARSMTRMRFNA
jgi:hypothetical protein